MSKRVHINGRTVWHRLIRPSSRDRMTQAINDRAEDVVPQGGIFSFLPQITRESSLTTSAPHGGRQGPGNEGVPPHTRSLQPSLHRHKMHHVVGMANDAENIIDLYDRNAKAWDRERPRKLLERAWLERFLSLVARGGSVLDIGCGTAEPIARFFIDSGFAVTGIDASPAMIQICRRRFANCGWLVADMRTLSLGKRFDGLLAWDSFFHLTPQDQRRMFPIFREHAASSAALLFTSGPRHGEAIGTFHGEPLYHGSLAATEYRRLLNDNGFDVIANVAEDPDCGGHTVWLARMR